MKEDITIFCHRRLITFQKNSASPFVGCRLLTSFYFEDGGTSVHPPLDYSTSQARGPQFITYGIIRYYGSERMS
jgi:hypothetical protein